MSRAKRIVIIAFPKGGYAVGPEDCGEWELVTETLDKALDFVRNELAAPVRSRIMCSCKAPGPAIRECDQKCVR